VADEHHRADGLGKSLEPFEQFSFRGGVELRHELDRAALAERRLDRLERLASAKRGGAEDDVSAFLRFCVSAFLRFCVSFLRSESVKIRFR
jgi:hypothetical protein